jgi:hypothetical protein
MPIPFITSSNDYFNQEPNKLLLNWKVVDTYLVTQEYTIEEIAVYKKAYDYFIENPNSYDGATMTEDLKDVFNLDLDAMLHDFFYLRYNVSASFKYTKIADETFYRETIRKGKSSWNAGVRNVLLVTKSLLGFHLIAKYILNRNMSEKDKTEFMSDISTLIKKT